ncbi:50S ribosomal protein L11 methyltransferase [Streptomyces armeniacus]|nr:50S ribosomal protein L11 methyltransferase [Streptomyces armeniacus]
MSQGTSDPAELRSFERSLERSRLSKTRPDRPRTFSMYDREWDLFEDVFPPVYTRSTAVSVELLGLDGGSTRLPERGSLLEVGCGAGVLAVLGALAGCERVVASDINPQAAANAARNAERHGVQDRLRSVQSDLFAALDPGERFDTIFWHSNYVRGPEDYEFDSVHDQAYIDPGYEAHRRYLIEAPHWTTPEGSALLHFCSRGDIEALRRIAESCDRGLRLLRTIEVHEGEYGDDVVEHLLFEVNPLNGSAATSS